MKKTLFLMIALFAGVFSLRGAGLESFLPAKADVVFGMQAEKLLESPLFTVTRGIFSFLTALGGEAQDPAKVLRDLKAQEAFGVIVEEEWAVVIRFGNGAGVEPYLAKNESQFIRMRTPKGQVFRRLKLDRDTCFFQPSGETLILCSENMFPYLDGRMAATGVPVRDTVKRFAQGKGLPLWLAIPNLRKYPVNGETAFFSYGWDASGHHFKGDVVCGDEKTAMQNSALLPMMVQLVTATLFSGDQQLMQDVCMLVKAQP